jgi:hypothetical protein
MDLPLWDFYGPLPQADILDLCDIERRGGLHRYGLKPNVWPGDSVVEAIDSATWRCVMALCRMALARGDRLPG